MRADQSPRLLEKCFGNNRKLFNVVAAFDVALLFCEFNKSLGIIGKNAALLIITCNDDLYGEVCRSACCTDNFCSVIDVYNYCSTCELLELFGLYLY